MKTNSIISFPTSGRIESEVFCSTYMTTIPCSVFIPRTNQNNPEPNRYIYHSDHLGSSAFLTDASGDPTQHLQYLPFGENFIEQRTTTDYYTPYTFSAKERDTETGYSYFGARYYNSDISVWLGVDPMADLRSWVSPYSFCQNNPIGRIDPTGALDGIFVDEQGVCIGNDGMDDGKVYVIKTTQTEADTRKNENPETIFAGISTTERDATVSFIKTNSGNSSAFQENDIAYRNSIEIVGDASLRQSMVDIVNNDNGKGLSSDPSNNREFGGNISNGTIVPALPSAIGNVRLNENRALTIDLFSDSPSFHSHASGTYSPMVDFNSYGQPLETKFWYQSPSITDINNAGSRTNYVFGRGNKIVYIYNSQGVQATIPQKCFVNPKQ